MTSWLKGDLPMRRKFFTEEELNGFGLDPILRAENISVEKYVELARALKYRNKV